MARMVQSIINERYGAPPELPPPPAPGEPIRVGIVSSFFYLHSNWKIPIKGWISQMDRSRFKIYGYHVGSRRDAETEVAANDVRSFRAQDAGHRRLATRYPGRQAACADLSGLVDGHGDVQLAAQRLARVQCNSWGHPETSGMSNLDCFFSSDLMEPPDGAEHYTEELVRLPNLSIYYEPVETEPKPITRAELGLRPGATAFWCGQSLFKYLPQYDQVFARIAKDGRQLPVHLHPAHRRSAGERTVQETARCAHSPPSGSKRRTISCSSTRLSQSQFIVGDRSVRRVPRQHRLVGLQLGFGKPAAQSADRHGARHDHARQPQRRDPADDGRHRLDRKTRSTTMSRSLPSSPATLKRAPPYASASPTTSTSSIATAPASRRSRTPSSARPAAAKRRQKLPLRGRKRPARVWPSSI